jgi:hypothetical protein
MITKSVLLDIETTNPGGYKTASTTPSPAPGGVTYYYKFSGGTNQNGDVDVTSQEKTEVNIALDGNANGKYDLHGATEKPDSDNGNGDIAVTFTGPNKITITDEAEKNDIEFLYTVDAIPKNSPTPPSVIIHCDPRVKNQW